MFWTKKNKIDPILIVFGIIALAIIIAVGYLLISLLNKVEKSENKNINYKVEMQEKILAVGANYTRAIEDMKLEIIDEDDISELYTEVEDFLFNVRVPENNRDVHLQTLFALADLKNQNLDIEETKIKVLELLNSLSLVE